MLVEMRKLNESFSKLEAELSVTKQVKTLLSSRLVSTERQCWLNKQTVFQTGMSRYRHSH